MVEAEAKAKAVAGQRKPVTKSLKTCQSGPVATVTLYHVAHVHQSIVGRIIKHTDTQSPLRTQAWD